MGQLDGKNIIITGAAQGMGAAPYAHAGDIRMTHLHVTQLEV